MIKQVFGHANELYIHCTHSFCMYYRSNYGQMKSYESLRCDVCRCCECSAAVLSAVGIWLRRAWELDIGVKVDLVSSRLVSHMQKSNLYLMQQKKAFRRSGNIFSFSKSTNIYMSYDRDHMQQYLEPNLCRTGS